MAEHRNGNHHGEAGRGAQKLFSAARDTVAELANMLTAKAPEEMEDDE